MNKTIFKLILTIFLIGNLSFVNGQCPTGNLVLSSQQSVDDFAVNYPNCTDFPHNLTIHGAGGITNLNGLSQIESIDGLFIIEGFSNLNDLSGLNNLNTINGSFFFRGNDGISNFNGLENLETIENDFLISDNNDLLNLSGLSSLQTINGQLTISDNFKLVSLDGIQSLTYINDGLLVTNNFFLTSFNGLNNLTSIGDGYIHIAHNGHLIDLSGLETLTTVNGAIYIAFNVSLNSLNGLNSLTTVNGNFTISGNNLITTLSALSNLTEINGNLQIDNIDSLSSLSGLENLNQINGSLTLLFITNLTNIEAIRNLDSSTLTSLQIGGNNQLSQCSVESVCDYLSMPVNNANISTNNVGCNTRQEVEDGCLLNNEDYQLSELKIYPNPTNNTFTISSLKEGKLKIIDSQGRTIKEMILGVDVYSISELSPGIYFVNITSEKASITKQIIKI